MAHSDRSPARFLQLALRVLLPAALLAGCTVGPDYVPPEMEMPDAWQQELADGLVTGETDAETWWTKFNDPVLESLIQRGAQGNLDLALAVTRIREARALRGIASSQYLPQVGGDGVISRNRLSESTNPFIPPGLGRVNTTYGVGIDAVWEADVWGRISRSVESADAGIQATIENYRDVLVLLYAEIASTYLEVRTLQARLDYAMGNAEAQNKSVKLTNDRFTTGISGELDVRQAELNLASTESVIPALQAALAQSINRLAVLIGDFPGTLNQELSAVAPLPDPPEEITVGLPADLLRMRPDIRQAERELAAQTARIGIATAELYPKFTLFGNLRLEALSSGDLLDSGNQAWGIGPAFSWRLFEGGRIRAEIEVEDARTEQALRIYEQTVLLAAEEVEDALIAFVREQQRRDSLAKAVEAARLSVELVQTQYRTGLTNFQNVLDMQRSLFQQQDSLAESEGFVVLNSVRVYKALGGGWASEESVPEEAPADEPAEAGQPEEASEQSSPIPEE